MVLNDNITMKRRQNTDDDDDDDEQQQQQQQQQQTIQIKEGTKGPEWKNALAGAGAGAFSKTAMAPIERVKLLIQLQGSVEKGSNGIAGQSAWTVAYNVYEKEGILAFWRGNFPNVLRTAGQSALNFALMDYYKSIASSSIWEKPMTVIQQQQKHQQCPHPHQQWTTSTEEMQRLRKSMSSFISGGLAGGTATTLLYPIEFLRTRLAMDLGRSVEHRKYRSMSDCIAKTFQADGIRGLYQGYGIALAGSVLYRLLFLGGYDAVKSEWQHRKSRMDEPDATWTERFILAQTVALTAGIICYPIDSVRRRLMMQAGKPRNQRLYLGSMQCFRRVWVEEGLRGFYLGIGPNMIRSIGGALMLVAYDAFKTML